MPGAVVRWSQRHASWLRTIAVFTPAVLLFIPILRYSLDTPFGLIDDYSDWKYSVIFTSPSLFLDWLEYTFISTENLRYRPFWEFYNATAWSVFGTNPWLHHLARWIFHFAMVALFALSFLCFTQQKEKDWKTSLVPVAFLIYILLFFPNSPASRLSPQEVYTAFFLGICTLTVALTLTDTGNGCWIRSVNWRYGLFALGYTGVLSSKEVNIGVALWLLISYVAWASMGTGKRRKLTGAIPLVLLFAFTAYRLTISSGTYDLFDSPLDRAGKMLNGLFQVETSLIITAVFSLLFTTILARTLIYAIKRQFWNERLFMLFLFGQVASLFLSVTLFSPIYTLRYWFIILPGFVLMMAFSLKYIEFSAQRISLRLYAPFCSLVLVFIAFFITVNYYHFSFHTLSQHRGRTLEKATLIEVSRLLDKEEYVYSLFLGNNEYDYNQRYYFDQYIPFFHGEHSNISWKGWPDVVNFSSEQRMISDHPPRDFPVPSYLVDYYDPTIERDLLEFLDVHWTSHGQINYGILSVARSIAQLLQAKTPFVEVDAGSPLPDYHSTIYRVNFGHHEDRIVDIFREIYMDSTLIDPIIRSFFNIYTVNDILVYVREKCAPEDKKGTFILHLTPTDVENLPNKHKSYGFHNLDFHFRGQGVSFEGRCVAAVQLPDYAIANIHTGQYSDEGTSWNVDFTPGLIDSMREVWGRAIDSTPVSRSTFDLYLLGEDLIYVREQCSPADTKGIFFLHLIPFSLDDLPADRRESGFDNLDFRFATRGASFNGRCVATVPLPGYNIASIRTGRYVGESTVWATEFRTGSFLDVLRMAWGQAVADTPIVRSTFDVYLLEDDLVYVREQCAPEDTDAWFFLHLTPVDADDLPGERREHGFDNLDFRFGTRGARFNGRCVASVRLPDYAIAGIRTGQYAAGGQIWRVEFAPDR